MAFSKQKITRFVSLDIYVNKLSFCYHSHSKGNYMVLKKILLTRIDRKTFLWRLRKLLVS